MAFLNFLKNTANAAPMKYAVSFSAGLFICYMYSTQVLASQTQKKIEPKQMNNEERKEFGKAALLKPYKMKNKQEGSFASAQDFKLSVVVPAYNEENSIERTLKVANEHAKEPTSLEIVVVDAGCTDGTMKIVDQKFQQKKLAKLITTSSTGGRGYALNKGADLATGELILFLHADTMLPEGYDVILKQAFADPATLMTAFRFGVNRKDIQGRIPFGLSIMEWGANLRSRFWWMPYGDQALCISKKNFQSFGRFPSFCCMEDYEFVRRVGKEAKEKGLKIKIMDQAALCSPRRWEKKGVFKNTLLNNLFVLGYHLGYTPDQIFHWYYGKLP